MEPTNFSMGSDNMGNNTGSEHTGSEHTRPHPVTDMDLLAYLDGEAANEVVAHVQSCPGCRARVQTLAQTQHALQQRLHRASCPESDDLRDFHFELLEPHHQQAIAQHLTFCPYCTRELFVDYVEVSLAGTGQAQTKAGSDAGETTRVETGLDALRRGAEQFIERLRLGVATLVDSGDAPAYALRTGPSAETPPQTHMYQVDDSMISLVVYTDPELPDHMAIDGQALLMAEPGEMAPGDTDIDAAVPSLQVHLWHQEQLAAVCEIDDAGDFTIPRLTPGRYELIFSSPRYKIKIPRFPVGQPPDHPA